MNSQNFKIVYFLITIVIIITFSHAINVYFTTNDDYQYYLRYYNDNSIWESSIDYAKQNGRFYFCFMQPIFNIILPNIYNSLIITNVFQIILSIIGVLLFAYILNLITNNRIYSVLFILSFCTFVTFKTDNNPVVSYPMYFSLAWILFLSSVYYFLLFQNRLKNNYKINSALLFFIALLFYEMYLIYILVFVLLSIKKYFENKFNLNLIVNIYKSVDLHILGLFIYLIIYLSFKHYYSNYSYDGVIPSNDLSFTTIFNTLISYTKGIMPLKHYFSNVYVYDIASEYIGGHKQSIITPFLHIKIEWLIKACSVSLILIYILKNKTKYQNETKTNNTLNFLMICILLFAPNLLISTTNKYQALAQSGKDYYLTSYYASYGIFIFIAIVILQVINTRNNFFRNLLSYFLIALFFISSILMDYANSYLKRDMYKVTNLFVNIDKLCENTQFSKLVDSVNVFYSKDLFQVNSALSYYNVDTFDIEGYFKKNNINKIKITKDSACHNKIIYKKHTSGYYFIIKTQDKYHLFYNSTKSKVLINTSDSSIFLKFNNKKGFDYYVFNNDVSFEDIYY